MPAVRILRTKGAGHSPWSARCNCRLSAVPAGGLGLGMDSGRRRRANLYRPSLMVTHSRNGHDGPGLIDEPVPGVAAMIDDIAGRSEDAIGQPIVAGVLP